MPDTFEKVAIQLKVNGKTHSLTVEPRMLLVELIREGLDLTGTHVGCDTTYCGACTVLMNGAAVKSCTIFAVQADGAEIMTVEGLGKRWPASSHSKSFWRCLWIAVRLLHAGADAFDRAVALDAIRQPSEKDIRKAIAGNTCRCTGYQNIFKAIQMAAQNMQGSVDVAIKFGGEFEVQTHAGGSL